jgi:3-phenylpropionate/trans-cinnamate dioxygenase ferredoxin reductase subunit
MNKKSYHYIIVGSGLAGISAIEGIREVDNRGSILVLGSEQSPPYDRPPLSKKLWTGKKKLADIFLHNPDFYAGRKAELRQGVTVTAVDPQDKTVTTERGERIGYSRLLLATGGIPRRLNLPGGDLPEICYYRTIEDYKRIHAQVGPGVKVIVVGGGFIGSEMAAALNMNKAEVTMIFPEDYLARRIFPGDLGAAVQQQYRERGVRILHGDLPVSFGRSGSGLVMRTKNGEEVHAELVIAGIGIDPSMDLAVKAGIRTSNGILVDKYLQTSLPGIYAAGDNAGFESVVYGKRMRVEHWDNAIAQGKTAGRTMAGQGAVFDYIPYFFSDLFEFGYEAAGETDSSMQTASFWHNKYEKGVVYYLNRGLIRGVLLCNVWDRIDDAKKLIREQAGVKAEELETALRF